MELLWKRLLQVIQEISGSCDSLIALAKKMREAIVHEQVRSVGELVIEQELEMKSFQALEQEREALIRAIQADLKLEEKVDAACLLRLVPASWSNDYRFHIEQLRMRMNQMKSENEVNRKLLQQSKQFIGWLIHHLVTPEGSGPVYDASGSSQQKSYYHFVNQNM